MYFCEEAYQKLLKQVLTKNDPEDLDTLKDVLDSFHAYVDTVVRGEISINLLGNENAKSWQEKISAYDVERHSMHEAAIINSRMLNRLAKAYEVDAVYTGGEDRKQVAAFCLEVDRYLFSNRRAVL